MKAASNLAFSILLSPFGRPGLLLLRRGPTNDLDTSYFELARCVSEDLTLSIFGSLGSDKDRVFEGHLLCQAAQEAP